MPDLKPAERIQLLRELYHHLAQHESYRGDSMFDITRAVLDDTKAIVQNDASLMTVLRDLPTEHAVWRYVRLHDVTGVNFSMALEDTRGVPDSATREETVRGLYRILEALEKADAAVLSVGERQIAFSMTLAQAFDMPWAWADDPCQYLAERVNEKQSLVPSDDAIGMAQLAARINELWIEHGAAKPTRRRRRKRRRPAEASSEAEP